MTITIEEPIDVITKFQHGEIVPMRIKWGERVYNVQKITSRWFFREGDFKEYFFALIVTGDRQMEIHLDTRDMSWELNKIEE